MAALHLTKILITYLVLIVSLIKDYGNQEKILLFYIENSVSYWYFNDFGVSNEKAMSFTSNSCTQLYQICSRNIRYN